VKAEGNVSSGDSKLDEIRNIPVIDIATHLNIEVRGKKAFCFSGHDKNTRSLSFEPHRNIWKCFGCDKKGDGIKLVMEALSCDFKTAMEWLSAEFGIQIDNPFLSTYRRVHTKAKTHSKQKNLANAKSDLTQTSFSPDTEIYTWLLRECGPVEATIGKAYLKNHGIRKSETDRFCIRELADPMMTLRKLIKQWGSSRVIRSGIAWSNDGTETKSLIWPSYALLFPFFEHNALIYLQGRLFGGPRKFVNPQGISKPLFNEERLRTLTKGAIVHICEGVPDAIALEGKGLPAVAVLGASSFRPEWVDRFAKFDVCLMPDGDAGGDIFVRIVSTCFQVRGKAVRVIKAPAGSDVAAVVAQETCAGRKRCG
jgi:DNA primase